MAYVEEEVPQDPPLEPTDSFLFSASDILTPPLTSGHHSLEGDFAPDLGGCPVEEEIPTVEQEEEAQPVGDSQPPVASAPDSPRTWRFSEEHLQLIFEMRRDVAEQLHRQTTLSRRLDVLFDALSSEPAKNRCPTCCQTYVFTLRPTDGDDNSGSPKV
jgi:hypothetical protein